jgi:predicted NAD/FAD-binding protein
VAGLTAAYVLQRDADVTLYEADERLGGRADTHDVPAAGGRLLGIDTGFIVHNERTYPALCLFVFLANHGMLSVKGAPAWRTVVGRSARYVARRQRHGGSFRRRGHRDAAS